MATLSIARFSGSSFSSTSILASDARPGAMGLPCSSDSWEKSLATQHESPSIRARSIQPAMISSSISYASPLRLPSFLLLFTSVLAESSLCSASQSRVSDLVPTRSYSVSVICSPSFYKVQVAGSQARQTRIQPSKAGSTPC